jgi:uncharacterized spore protein YtfJ
MDNNDEEMEPIEIEDVYDDQYYQEFPPSPAVDMAESTLENFLAAAHVDAVYGEPMVHDDTLILPAAEVLAIMGFGAGSGLGKSGEQGAEIGSGGASGGGGRVLSRPVAVVIVSPDGVRVEPVVDVTKIAVAALTALTFLVGLGARMRRMRRTLERVD